MYKSKQDGNYVLPAFAEQIIIIIHLTIIDKKTQPNNILSLLVIFLAWIEAWEYC